MGKYTHTQLAHIGISNWETRFNVKAARGRIYTHHDRLEGDCTVDRNGRMSHGRNLLYKS